MARKITFLLHRIQSACPRIELRLRLELEQVVAHADAVIAWRQHDDEGVLDLLRRVFQVPRRAVGYFVSGQAEHHVHCNDNAV